MIRRAMSVDLASIYEIEKECFDNPWTISQYQYELNENPYAQIWVMEEKGEIIGYYDLWIIFEKAELANIAVKKQCWAKGNGDKLMKHIEERAIESQCETISLEVRVDNLPALKLYQKHGFITINTKPGYYKSEHGSVDAYFMMKGI